MLRLIELYVINFPTIIVLFFILALFYVFAMCFNTKLLEKFEKLFHILCAIIVFLMLLYLLSVFSI
jgi:hypothetical protein